jgi:O-antigen ligase
MILRAIIYGGTIASCVSLLQFFLQFFIPLNTLLSFWSHISPIFLGGSFSNAVITYNSWLVNVGGHDLMRAVAFFPDPHMLSFYLGMIAPLPLVFFYITQSKKWIVIFFIIIIADLLTFSRGGYIGLVSGTFIGMLLMWNHLSVKFKHLVFLLMITIFFTFLIPNNPISQRFVSSFGFADTSTSHRITLWTQAIDYIEQKPLLGTGLGAYAYVISPHTDYRTPIYVHNLYLDIFVELGLVGVIIFFAIFVRLMVIMLWKNSLPYNKFVIISLVIYLTHSFFDTAIFSVHILPILIFFFALGSHYENPKKIR